MNNNHGRKKNTGMATLAPPPLASCRARHIFNSDQVECLSPGGKGCAFVLNVGRSRICLHPQRDDIAVRA
ncbi:MAG: hypothetical protein HZC54_21150 [Verrucomicrobia bacterium]|nr:hypothetical protein [Verrucomicrobiota bacterium]